MTSTATPTLYDVVVVTRKGERIEGTMRRDGVADLMVIEPYTGGDARYVSSLDTFEQMTPKHVGAVRS